MMKCGTCKLSVNIDKEEHLLCDSCRSYFHFHGDKEKNCSGVSPTELRAVGLKNRMTLFFCNDCRDAFKRVPMVIKRIDDLNNQIASLNTEVIKLKAEVEDLKSHQDGHQMEEIFEEIGEREKRAYNIMIYNIEESEEEIPSDRVKADKIKIKETLKLVGHDLKEDDIDRVIRIGKKMNSHRPIKVCLRNTQVVKEILSRSYMLKNSTYSISADRTKMQMNHFKKIRNEFKNRVDSGEQDIKIKYVQGNPKIVKSKN